MASIPMKSNESCCAERNHSVPFEQWSFHSNRLRRCFQVVVSINTKKLCHRTNSSILILFSLLLLLFFLTNAQFTLNRAGFFFFNYNPGTPFCVCMCVCGSNIKLNVHDMPFLLCVILISNAILIWTSVFVFVRIVYIRNDDNLNNHLKITKSQFCVYGQPSPMPLAKRRK